MLTRLGRSRDRSHNIRYISAIEGGGVPTISTAWEEVMAKECASARDAGLAEYDAKLAEATERLAEVESAHGQLSSEHSAASMQIQMLTAECARRSDMLQASQIWRLTICGWCAQCG